MFPNLCLLWLAAACGLPRCGAEEAAAPNILWIIAEDMGPELSCYGTPEVHTPAIDALADRDRQHCRRHSRRKRPAQSHGKITNELFATLEQWEREMDVAKYSGVQ